MIFNRWKKKRKCVCDNPDWSILNTSTSYSGRLQITLTCKNCKAAWDTNKRESRNYIDPSNQNYIEIFSAADELREKSLQKSIVRYQEKIKWFQSLMIKAQSELEFLEHAPVIPEGHK